MPMADVRSVLYPLGAVVTIPDLEGDPHALLACLRANEPVSWLPALDCWLVTRHDLALEVVREAETFTVDDTRFSTAQVVGPSMLGTVGPSRGRSVWALCASDSPTRSCTRSIPWSTRSRPLAPPS
jgi:hypothetical protein